jgi:two-component system, NarL family, response regulator DesR
MPPRVRVLCIDDNRLMARAMERRLAFENRIEWVGWVEDAAHASEVVRKTSPHVILLDIDLPGWDAFVLLRQLVAMAPETKVVMFSGHVRAEYLDRAVDAGAWGYLSKNESMNEIIEAIGRVAAGEFVLTPEVAAERGTET